MTKFQTPDHFVALTDDEILALDGLCRPEVQLVIERVRNRRAVMPLLPPGLPPHTALYCAHLLGWVLETKALTGQYSECSTFGCTVCGEEPRPTLFRRGARYGQVKAKGEWPVMWLRRDAICLSCWSVVGPTMSGLLRHAPVEIDPAVARHMDLGFDGPAPA